VILQGAALRGDFRVSLIEVKSTADRGWEDGLPVRVAAAAWVDAYQIIDGLPLVLDRTVSNRISATMRQPLPLVALLLAGACASPELRTSSPLPADGAQDAIGAKIPDDSDGARSRALGAAIGRYLQNVSGINLPQASLAVHDDAARHALWTQKRGRGRSWEHRESGFSGRVTATSKTFHDAGGATCRRFRDELITPRDAVLVTTGSACLYGRVWVVTAQP